MPCHSSPEEALTRQFYEWERRGRGWQIWSEPVELEPGFRPFFGHFIARSASVVDDGRRSTFLSSLVSRLGPGSRSRNQAAPALAVTEPPEVAPQCFEDSGALAEFQIALPPQTKISKDAAEQFLLSLGHVSRPISFEIVGARDSIIVQLACGERDQRNLREQVHAFFPDAAVTDCRGYLKTAWGAPTPEHTAIVEFGLSHEFMRPIRCFDRFEPDPLAAVIGAMSGLEEGDVALVQILFSPTKNPWAESILRAVTDGQGESFFADDPTVLPLAGRKIARPLFATVIRVAACDVARGRSWRIVESIAHAFNQFADPQGNEFIPLRNDEYDDADHLLDLLQRRSCRSGALLNSDELVSLIHLPSASVRSEKLKREGTKTKAAPSIAVGHRLELGENYHGGKTTTVTASAEQRSRHMYVVGVSGTGKSTLLLNLIVQDIEQGEGVAVLDPHGDLIDEVLRRIPEERLTDVVLIDPSDDEYPIAFNILSARSDMEKNLLASDLVSVFRRLSTSWGDQMTAVLANAIIAILESTTGGTLLDLRRFLIETDFRRQFLQTVSDPGIVYYWEKEFPLLTGKPHASILTRLDSFLRPKLIRHMVAQKNDRLDFTGIMNGRKILLAKLSQGLIGEENSYLLGTLIVSKLNQTAMSRQGIQSEQRTPFYAYIDEFHNFVTPSMAAILAGARKYGLSLTLAHQELRQLQSRDSDLASAVISNPSTRICFRLGDADAAKLEDGFSFFEARDLQNLGIGEAICRMERSGDDFNLKTKQLPIIDSDLPAQRCEHVVALSRERYATPRAAVESALWPERTANAAPRTAPEKVLTSKPSVPPPLPETLGSEVIAVLPERPQPGRGGPQHKYLQQLVRRWAESKGYRVVIEKQILGGLGAVDVVLEKADVGIACEISVTTGAEHELGNIQKCLAAGFAHVAVLATEKKTLRNIQAAAQALSPSDLERVHFFMPEELFSFLEAIELPTPADTTVRGYKVKVKIKSVSDDEQSAKKQAIAHTILHAMRRMKSKDPA